MAELRVKSRSELRRARRRQGHSCWDHLIVAPLWAQHGANLGTLLRTCDAVGACMAVPSHDWVKNALRKGNTLPGPSCIHRVGNPQNWLLAQRERGSHIIGVELAEGATRLGDLPPARGRTVVVLGHEFSGIPSDTLHLLDEAVEIPMIGRGASLNVAVAGSLVLYRLAGLAGVRSVRGMTAQLWLDSIAADGARIAAIDPAHLALPVPSCPGWTVREGVVHTAGAHRWATAFLQAGPDSKERFIPDVSDAPDGDAVLGWYAGVNAALLDELRRHEPDEPARAFIGRTVAAFWMRRMTQEVSIHRWDLQNSLPDGAEPLPAWTAADGITELTQMQIPLIVGKKGLPEALVGKVIAIEAIDTGDRWTLRLRADGIDVLDEPVPADVTLRGTASDLDLVLWRRAEPGTVDLEGERAVLDGLLDVVIIGAALCGG